MRRFFAVCLLLALVLACAACGSAPAAPANEAGQAPAEMPAPAPEQEGA